jgi:GH24 family phage-related lysozyme (muramidase)
MHVSQRGLDLIARFEGTVLHAYNDPAGHCTVGVGHLLHHGNCTSDDYRVFGTSENPRLTRDKAMQLLALDVTSREAAVDRLVRVRLNQNEFDALVSFVFNVGAGNFEESTLLRLLNDGRRREAADQFGRWVFGAPGQKLPGLVTRRAAERELFLKPVRTEPSVNRPKDAPKDLPEKWFDHWRRPWLRKARRNIGFRHWLGRHGYLTPHFTKAEAASKAGARCPTAGIPKLLIPAARNHAFRLERLRHALGDRPMSPLSWYRSPCHNTEVGGARHSKHLAAIATDFVKAWVDRSGGQAKLTALAKELGFKGVGTYPGGNMHLDSRHGLFTTWHSWTR